MILETRNIDEAIRQALEFQKLVRGEEVQVSESKSEIVKTGQVQANTKTPNNLSDLIEKYTDWLADKEVPEHLKRNRSENHVKDVKHQFEILKTALAFNSIDSKLMSIHGFNDEIVGKIYKFLRENMGYGNRMVNKIMGNCKSLFRWYPENYNMPVRNWFKKVKKLPEKYEPRIISYKDFELLKSRVKPENGLEYYEKGKKRIRNFYFSYLIPAFQWGVHLGLRREELINLRHCDVFEKNGKSFIRVENLKSNRIQGRQEESEKSYLIYLVTDDIKQLLEESGHEQFKNTDRYIIAPEVTKNRVRGMRDSISRGFNHFYKMDHPDGKLTFKCLRKTYLSNLNKYMGNEASGLTHSSQAVLDKHYLNKEKLAEKAYGFGTFNEEIRQEQLNDVRTSKSTQGKDLGYEFDK